MGYEDTDEQDQQQGGGGGGVSPYYQPSIMPSEKADLFDKIKPEATVEIIKRALMGYEWNDNKQEWILRRDLGAKGLTEIGAWKIATLMLPVSSKNVSISNLQDNEIRDRTKSIVRTAMKMCLRNWKEYGIYSKDQILLVKEVVLSNTFITLKQPQNAGVRSFIQGSSQEIRTINEAPKGGGMLSSLFRR